MTARIKFGRNKNTIQAGARGFISEGDDLADNMCNIIRGSKDDIPQIAKNIGYKTKNIKKFKDHLFHKIHLLDMYEDYGVPSVLKRFDSDIKIANAWKRLKNGRHSDIDIMLLKHEMAELNRMNKWGNSY